MNIQCFNYSRERYYSSDQKEQQQYILKYCHGEYNKSAKHFE